jgi:hypothetical protein
MITRIARSFLPRRLRHEVKRRILALGEPPPLDLLSADPWSSPNVWERTIGSYRRKTAPAIFEYGCGCSSIHHVRNLLAHGGGSYTAVEHDRGWFNHVCAALLEVGLGSGSACSARARPSSSPGVDFDLEVEDGEDRICRARLRYRAPHTSFPGGEGSADEFDAYIRAISDGPYDLIVVDGRARKACVNHVLDCGLIAPGGTLALFEAGRGTPDWLGSPTTIGDADYQPVVRRMLALGGCLVDGVGYYSWPQPDGKLTALRRNPPIPLEACFLTPSSDPDHPGGGRAPQRPARSALLLANHEVADPSGNSKKFWEA